MNPMAKHHDRSLIDRAERMYIHDRLSITRIASDLNVARTTMNDWKKNRQWEERREQRYRERIGQEEQLDRLKTILLQKVMAAMDDGDLTSLDPKTLNVLCRVIGTLSPPASVQLKQMERNEAKARESTVEERMHRMMTLLGQEGFYFQDEEDEIS
jgi:hypothetical protein